MIDTIKALASKAWQYIAGIAAGIAALAWLLLQRRTAQRDEARKQRDTAKRSQKATQAKADKDADIRKAGAKARQDNAQARDERNEQTVDERRSGGQLGDHSRLRK